MAKYPHVVIRGLIVKIQPRPKELQKAMLHSITVKRRLNKSFDLKKFVKIGSHSRATAIRSFSDVDFMPVLARNEAKWAGKTVNSSSVLSRIRDDLSERFPFTKVRRDLQAVVVEFGSGQHAMDIVPAIFSRFVAKTGPVFWIPDGYDEWIESSPQSQRVFMKKANNRSGSKLYRVIQLLKWWKFSRSSPIPIDSFHLEMLLAASDICTGVKSYSQCLFDSFKLLAERECRGLRDPLGISGVIYAAKTDGQWKEINQAVNYALEHSRKAVQAESWKDYEEAIRQWNIVFNWST